MYAKRKDSTELIMATATDYDDAVERVRRLERALAHTSHSSVEYDDMQKQLNDAQRNIKAITIALGNQKMEIITESQHDEIMIEADSSVNSNESIKRKSKQKQQVLGDTFFQNKSTKKARIQNSAIILKPLHTPTHTRKSSNDDLASTSKQTQSNSTKKTSLSVASQKNLSNSDKHKPRTYVNVQHKPLIDEPKIVNTPSDNTPTKATSTSQNEPSIQVKSIQSNLKPMNYKAAAATLPSYNKFTIRVNMSVPGFQKPGDAKDKGIHSVITKLSNDLQSVDPTASILPWNASLDLSHPMLAFDSIRKINSKQSMPYIKTNVRQCFVQNRTHYRQGIRITTQYDADTFINIWNSSKREIQGMFGISQAETQHHHQHALIGICCGSSQQKDNSFLLEELRTISGLSTLDGSWQSIMVGDQTRTLWDEAERHATKEQKATNNKYFNVKARRFDWAPTGLSLYAPTEAEARKVREILIEKYSKNVSNGVFPQWPDGSRMKFLPLSNKTLSKNSADKVATRVRFHSYLKAKEQVLNIPDVNPWETIPNSQITLGQYLHSIVDDKGLPVFRHIVKKWTSDPEAKEWQITCFGAKSQLAKAKLYTLAEDLRTLYGDDAATFVSISPLLPSRTSTSDIDTYYDNLLDEENQEFILEPGYQELFTQNEMESMNITDADSTLMLSEVDTVIHQAEKVESPSPDSSIESSSVGTNTTRSVHFDASVNSASNLSPEDAIAKTINKYQIDPQRYEELTLKHNMLFNEVTQHHNKKTNIVKVFLKMLRSLKIPIKSAEAGQGLDQGT